jgi:hypothetical protein
MVSYPALCAQAVLAFILSAGVVPCRSEDELSGRILGNRVNLRAKAEGHSEVVGQASEGDVLTIKSIGPEWVEVVPPTNVQLWVHREFLDGSRVAVDKLNVRAGAGINFSVVGQLAEGDQVALADGFGEWASIAPPPSCSLWVSRELIEPMYPETPEALPAEAMPVVVQGHGEMPKAAPVKAVQAPPAPGPSGPPKEAAQAPESAPKGLALVPLQGQGAAANREGEVKLSPVLMAAPGPYRLVARDGVQVKTICYLSGHEEKLSAMQGRLVKVSGREYWVQGFREPVIAVEQVTPSIAPLL